MIAVLMRDEDGVEGADVFADILEFFADLFPAQPGIDQDACMAVSDERRVPGTAAGENADPDDRRPPCSD